MDQISAMTNPHFWWYLSRASGIVAWGLLTASVVWGVLLATRILKPYDRPAWLLDLHRWLGFLTILAVALNMVALFADSFVEFSVRDLLVPMSTTWRPWAVASGILAMYLLVAVQLSSVVMRKIPKKVWRVIHLTSYLMFCLVTLHSFLAGSDRGKNLFNMFALAVILMAILATSIRVLYTRTPTRKVITES